MGVTSAAARAARANFRLRPQTRRGPGAARPATGDRTRPAQTAGERRRWRKRRIRPRGSGRGAPAVKTVARPPSPRGWRIPTTGRSSGSRIVRRPRLPERVARAPSEGRARQRRSVAVLRATRRSTERGGGDVPGHGGGSAADSSVGTSPSLSPTFPFHPPATSRRTPVSTRRLTAFPARGSLTEATGRTAPRGTAPVAPSERRDGLDLHVAEATLRLREVANATSRSRRSWRAFRLPTQRTLYATRRLPNSSVPLRVHAR